MVFIDSNVPMYVVGAPHPNKVRVLAMLAQLVDAGERLVTDVEVYQEMAWWPPLGLTSKDGSLFPSSIRNISNDMSAGDGGCPWRRVAFYLDVVLVHLCLRNIVG